MRYCPKCDFTYKDTSLKKCPDCKSRLVIKTTGATRAAVDPDDSWVVIGDIDRDYNMDLARGALEAGNIPAVFVNSEDKQDAKDIAFLLNEGNIEQDRSLIMVPKEYERRAALVLGELMGLQLNMNTNKDNWF